MLGWVVIATIVWPLFEESGYDGLYFWIAINSKKP
jgi:hypothetical protein